MSDIKQLSRKIFGYTVGIAVFFQLIAVVFIGFDIKFTYGLLLGMAISIFNFNLLAVSLEKCFASKNNKIKILAMLGYVLRMFIYGLCIYYSLQVGVLSFFGTIASFIAIKIATYLVPIYTKKS